MAYELLIGSAAVARQLEQNGEKMARFSTIILILWVVSWAAQANVPAPSDSKQKLGENFKNIQSFMSTTNAVLNKASGAAVSGLNTQLDQAKLRLGLQSQLNIVQGPIVTDPAPMIYSGERYQGIAPRFTTPYYNSSTGLNEAAWSQAFPAPRPY
jgi:hypothetical protein